MGDFRSVEINGAMRGHAVELQLDVPAAIRRIELEGAPIPTDAAWTIALLLFRFGIERLLNRPIMREVHLPPVAVVVTARRRTQTEPAFAPLCVKSGP